MAQQATSGPQGASAPSAQLPLSINKSKDQMRATITGFRQSFFGRIQQIVLFNETSMPSHA
jgi:hypothetical protein